MVMVTELKIPHFKICYILKQNRNVWCWNGSSWWSRLLFCSLYNRFTISDTISKFYQEDSCL